ncbi:hypothetical protein BDB00DRAFT_363056 [Zychaea mexicana]|uniref:uncharacterized protein n=1 Tax=Zychaea mexicana TaxID=64656 RepID=UPI0022FE43DF|nr:uncharacterized protein BDB00DRAFT_363056 [Zychaea mexicana]KAI9493698.1 hypothetical protein BDB00DRAFT_363056 [Zychaea mexicana]
MSSFDTKQPPFRILFQRDINTNCLQIAVGETEAVIEAAWIWIERNMMPELDTIDDPFEKEQWVAQKISMIVTTIDTGTDELSSDEKVRSASRTFRQLFDVPPSERLVNRKLVGIVFYFDKDGSISVRIISDSTRFYSVSKRSSLLNSRISRIYPRKIPSETCLPIAYGLLPRTKKRYRESGNKGKDWVKKDLGY